MDDKEIGPTTHGPAASFGARQTVRRSPLHSASLAIWRWPSWITRAKPATVKVGDGNIIETSKGGKVELPVKVTRRGRVQGGHQARLDRRAERTEARRHHGQGKYGQDGKLTLQATNNNLKPGFYTFYLKGDAKYPYLKTAMDISDLRKRRAEGSRRGSTGNYGDGKVGYGCQDCGR